MFNAMKRQQYAENIDVLCVCDVISVCAQIITSTKTLRRGWHCLALRCCVIELSLKSPKKKKKKGNQKKKKKKGNQYQFYAGLSVYESICLYLSLRVVVCSER